MKRLIVTVAATLLGCTPVVADGLYNWTGIYWGAQTGAGSASLNGDWLGKTFSSSTITTNGVIIPVTSSVDDHYVGASRDTAFGAEMFLGANYRVSPGLVIGLQLEGGPAHAVGVTRGSLARSVQCSNPLVCGPGTTTQLTELSVRVDWTAGIVGRVGWLPSNRTLVYAAGGWMVATAEFDNLAGRFQNPGPFSPTANAILQGWQVGVGIEHKLSSAWSLRAEYRFQHLSGDDTAPPIVLGTGNTTAFNGRTSLALEANVARVGVAYQFGQ